MSASVMSKKRLYLNSLNWFRGIAILFVFFTHVSKDSFPDLIRFVLESVLSNGTFYFVFIAGYLFWHLSYKFSYKNYLKTKLENVIFPYFFVYFPVLVLIGLLSNYFSLPWDVNFVDPFGENGLLWHMLVGGMTLNGPLWFIPMISVFFISSFPIYYISNSRFFVLFFAIAGLFSLLSFRAASLGEPIYSFFHFLGVYFFGIFCKKNEDYIWSKSKSIVKVSFLFYVIFIMLDLSNNNVFHYVRVVDHFTFDSVNINNFQKAFGTMFFLSLFFELEKQNWQSKCLDSLAKYSFGIFFVHYYWIVLVRNVVDNFSIFDKYGAAFFVVSIISFSFTLLSVILVTRLFKNNSRKIIGC